MRNSLDRAEFRLRLSGQISRRIVAQSLRRSGQAVLAREAVSVATPPLLVKPKIPKIRMSDPVKPNRFDGVTYQRHINGLRGEEIYARWIHSETDEIVFLWGDGVGTNGVDIATISPKGRVTLCDAKWRSSPKNVYPTKTFSEPRRLENALRQTRQALIEADYLPEELRLKGLESLQSGGYRTITPGVGEATSSGVQFVHPEIPPQ